MDKKKLVKQILSIVGVVSAFVITNVGKNLREQIMELESEIETRKLTEAFTGGGDKAAAREKVDTLIREIGKCISCLEEA